jgi:dihydrofolate reductase
MTIRTSAILAMSENRVIGKDNRLPWHIPEDLKFFKRMTMGKPVIMGRRSYESLGKPLPGRDNIVASRKHKSLAGFRPTAHFAGMESVGEQIEDGSAALLCASVEEAVDMAKKIAASRGLDEIFITGGGEIYRAAMALTDRIYMTVIHRAYDGDTFFPALDMAQWREVSAERHEGDPAFTIRILDRAPPTPEN